MKFLIGRTGCWVIFLSVILVGGLFFAPEFAGAAVQDEGIDRGIRDKLVEPSIPDKELRSADKLWEETERFILIGDIQAYGSYSDLDSDLGNDDEWGGSFYGLIAPAYKLAERMMFILLYDGQYDRRMDVYSDEYGFRKITEFQRHAVTPMLRIDFGENSRYSLTPSVFFTRTWNKEEGQDDSWDKGLYNYTDKGVGLDFDMRECMGEYGALKIGAQYYAREYPNYTNLLFEYDPIAFRRYQDEKDYHGIIGKVGYYWITDAGFSWLTEYSLLYKRLDDKTTINSVGVLSSSTKQQDYIHEMDIKLWYFFDDIAGGLKVGLDFGCRIYDSNENFLFGTALANYAVNKDFFDYRAYSMGPNVAYLFETIPLTASLSYSHEYLDYTDRWARDSTGNWAERDEQWERYDELVFGLKFDSSEKLSFLAQWEYIQNRSNNDDTSVYVYDYEVNIFLLGAKYTF